MRWQPLTAESAVALLSAAAEHAIIDFKGKYNTADPATLFEIAKDICAFANHLGGTVVVGAHEGKGEQRGRLVKFGELRDPAPGDLVKSVDDAIKRFCLPVPIADAVEIELSPAQVTAILGRPESSASIVAINVPPMLNTPVGCLSCSETCRRCQDSGVVCSQHGKPIANAYRFPIRAIESTRFLRPDELAKTMNIAERRALLELQAIQAEVQVLIWFNANTGKESIARPCKIENLNAELMTCTLRLLVGSIDATAEVPLTFVRACWRSSAGWNVAIDGAAFSTDGAKRAGYSPPGGIIV